ncbi:MAG: hypothetical protein ABH950_07095, partial [Candidatus Altiarchaeota archaeon]
MSKKKDNGQSNADEGRISSSDHDLEKKRKELKSLELLLLEKEIANEKRKLESKIEDRKKALASTEEEETIGDVKIQQWLSKLEMLEGQLKIEMQQSGQEKEPLGPTIGKTVSKDEEKAKPK